jgi:hypothetical protein
LAFSLGDALLATGDFLPALRAGSSANLTHSQPVDLNSRRRDSGKFRQLTRTPLPVVERPAP